MPNKVRIYRVAALTLALVIRSKGAIKKKGEKKLLFFFNKGRQASVVKHNNIGLRRSLGNYWLAIDAGIAFSWKDMIRSNLSLKQSHRELFPLSTYPYRISVFFSYIGSTALVLIFMLKVCVVSENRRLDDSCPEFTGHLKIMLSEHKKRWSDVHQMNITWHLFPLRTDVTIYDNNATLKMREFSPSLKQGKISKLHSHSKSQSARKLGNILTWTRAWHR